MARTIRFTPKQRRIFDFIRSYLAENGYAPSLEEIREHMGLASVSTVHEHLTRMEARGILKRQGHIPRSTELTVAPVAPATQLPLLGSVIAGAPTESFLVQETISVPADMVGRGRHYAVRVMGESMRDEDIAEGDILVVRHTNRALPGDLVVALVGGREATVKRFFPERNHVRLQPSNRDLKPIRVARRSVQVQGIVVGLLRNYRRP
ncbi:MAG: transcriptional repressor LexA [Candidatus Krumholzibacteriia bacterium]